MGSSSPQAKNADEAPFDMLLDTFMPIYCTLRHRNLSAVVGGFQPFFFFLNAVLAVSEDETGLEKAQNEKGKDGFNDH